MKMNNIQLSIIRDSKSNLLIKPNENSPLEYDLVQEEREAGLLEPSFLYRALNKDSAVQEFAGSRTV